MRHARTTLHTCPWDGVGAGGTVASGDAPASDKSPPRALLIPKPENRRDNARLSVCPNAAALPFRAGVEVNADGGTTLVGTSVVDERRGSLDPRRQENLAAHLAGNEGFKKSERAWKKAPVSCIE